MLSFTEKKLQHKSTLTMFFCYFIYATNLLYKTRYFKKM